MLHEPPHLPFLEAIAWQRGGVAQLSPEERMSLYERNWRQLGVIADPSPEELAYIRELAHLFQSDLSASL